MMVTIYDVAKHAGVSIATVSRVLNNRGHVKESTRLKVEASIQQLSYTPSSIARKLFNKTTTTIGLLIPDISNPLFPELYKQIEKHGEKVGCNILLFNSNYDINRERSFLNLMRSNIIDAAIIVSDTLTEDMLEGLDYPMVTLDRKISELVSSITVNNYKGARQAVNYLFESGSRTIAHIAGPGDNFSTLELFRGYQDEVKEHGLQPIMMVGGHGTQQAAVATNELFKRFPGVDGIFAGSDMVALGVVKALTKRAIDFSQLNLTGFDGIRLGISLAPEISTLVQPVQQIAESAIELLVSKSPQIQHLVYEVELLKRDT